MIRWEVLARSIVELNFGSSQIEETILPTEQRLQLVGPSSQVNNIKNWLEF